MQQNFLKNIILVLGIVLFSIVPSWSQKTVQNGMKEAGIKLYQIHKYAYAEKSFIGWMQNNATITDTLVLKLLGDCEWKLREYGDAYQIYWRLYRISGFAFTSEMKKRLADLNAMNEQYNDGIGVLNNDSKWTQKKQGFFTIDIFKTDSLDWTITYPLFNSIAAEYLPYYPGKDLLFFNTDRQTNNDKYKVDLWTGGGFSNMKYYSGISNMPLSKLTYTYKHGHIENFSSSLTKTGVIKKLAVMHEGADVPLLNHQLYSWADSINREKSLLQLKLKPENYFNKGCISVQTNSDTSKKTPVYFVADINSKINTKNYLKKDTFFIPLGIYKGNLYSKNNEMSIEDISKMTIDDFDGELLHTTVSKDGQVLVFSAKANNKNDYDLYYATRTSDVTWGSVIAFGKNVNTYGNEVFPQLQNDGTLYFSSDGLPGLGALDLFKIKDFYAGSKINAKNIPEHLGYPVNTAFDDYGITVVNQSTEKLLTKELKIEDGFFSSNRAGTDDIFHFKYRENYKIACGFIGGRTPNNQYEPLSNAKVVIKQKTADENSSSDSAVTDSGGKYCIVIKPGSKYDIKVAKTGWLPATDTFKMKISPDSLIDSYEIASIVLEKEPSVSVPVIDSVPNKNKNTETEKSFIIHHYFDNTTICKEDLAIIDSAVLYIKSHVNSVVEIVSAADCFGSARYAEKLSKRRSDAITAMLRERGVVILKAKAVGQNERMIDCNKAMTIAAQLPNRYTKILIKVK